MICSFIKIQRPNTQKESRGLFAGLVIFLLPISKRKTGQRQPLHSAAIAAAAQPPQSHKTATTTAGYAQGCTVQLAPPSLPHSAVTATAQHSAAARHRHRSRSHWIALPQLFLLHNAAATVVHNITAAAAYAESRNRQCFLDLALLHRAATAVASNPVAVTTAAATVERYCLRLLIAASSWRDN